MIEDIASRVCDFSYDGLSPAAKERLLLCLLANLSVGVAGVRYCALPEPVREGRYRLLSGHRTDSAREAAFWNAATMHARTQDDFHPVGNLHIGTVVLPALMALADEMPVSGRAFLDGLGAGYMVAVGLSRRFSPLTTPRGLRSTGYYSPFGASAAVARARGASREETASAIAMTTVFAAGTTQAWIDGSDEWQLHPAHGAETGLRTNELARAGLHGGAHALDGEAGFYNGLVGRRPTMAELAGDFDPSAAIEENVIKRYPVSGICQSVVLASERVAQRLGAGAEGIRRVTVQMNPFEMRYPGTLNRGPFNAFGAKLMSARFCTASVLSRGGFDFPDFHAGGSPSRERIIALVDVVEDTDLPLLSARVSVELANGETLREEVRNSREEVAIDWASVDPWAIALWEEAGRDKDAYQRCRDAVLALPEQEKTELPF